MPRESTTLAIASYAAENETPRTGAEDGALEAKYSRMRALIGRLGRVVVAYSGGADSALVLKTALDVLGRENVLAVTGRSASLARVELEGAVALARRLGAEHLILDTDEFDNPSYTSNPANRCYFCKSTLYARLRDVCAQRGFLAILNGTNADDLGDYRPGLRAAAEFAVQSPAVEAGLTKQDIRRLSRRLNLPTADKPASPCLSSRVPYGQPVTPEKLRMIERAEGFLRSLGVPQCRVRHHGPIARIEVPFSSFGTLTSAKHARAVHEQFRSLGFLYVTLDLAGLRSGSLNEPVSKDGMDSCGVINALPPPPCNQAQARPKDREEDPAGCINSHARQGLPAR